MAPCRPRSVGLVSAVALMILSHCTNVLYKRRLMGSEASYRTKLEGKSSKRLHLSNIKSAERREGRISSLDTTKDPTSEGSEEKNSLRVSLQEKERKTSRWLNNQLKSHDRTCAVCGNASSKRCSACAAAYYCSREHQAKHWPVHKTVCKNLREEAIREERLRSRTRLASDSCTGQTDEILAISPEKKESSQWTASHQEWLDDTQKTIRRFKRRRRNESSDSPEPENNNSLETIQNTTKQLPPSVTKTILVQDDIPEDPPNTPTAERFFETFSNLAEAKIFRGNNTDLLLFAREHGSDGQRTFIVSMPNTFFRRYMQIPAAQRSYHEVIPEGRPCHLYLDVEFYTNFNPNVDGDALVDTLLDSIDFGLKNHLNMSLKPEWILELDSSKDLKFSRHIIIQIPGYAFKTSRHVKEFIHTLYAPEPYGLGQEALIVNTEKGKTSFIDLAVYNRNHCFRLYLSTKFDKNRFLIPTKRQAAQHRGKGLSAWHVFERSLITKMTQTNLTMLECSCSVLPEKLYPSMFDASQSPFPSHTSRLSTGVRVPPKYGPSPYPNLENFILETASAQAGGATVNIRSWIELKSGIFIFNLKDSRYCGNIGRMHRSNGVYYVADLVANECYQKCYDPDCRHYRSSATALPHSLQALHKKYLAKVRQEKYLQRETRNRELIDQNTRNVTNSTTGNVKFSKIAVERALKRAIGELFSSQHDSSTWSYRTVFYALQKQIPEEVLKEHRLYISNIIASHLGIENQNNKEAASSSASDIFS